MILKDLLLLTAYIGTIAALLTSFGANIYDMQEAKKKKTIAAHPYSRQYKKRPFVSVLVSTHNDSRTIEQCLYGLLKSSYRKFEVIIVDNASQDNTKGIIKNLIKQYPNRSIRLVARRSNKEGSGVLQAYKKHGKGELILLLSAGSILEKKALGNATRHFNVEDNIDVLNFKHDVRFIYSTAGLFQKYNALLQYASQKFASVSRSGYTFNTFDSLYRREAFAISGKFSRGTGSTSLMAPATDRKLTHRTLRSYYANDALIYVMPFQSLWHLLRQRYRIQQNRVRILGLHIKLLVTKAPGYTRSLSLFRFPLTVALGTLVISVPVLLTYFLYMTFQLHEPSFLILSCVIIGMFLLYAIWSDEHLKFYRKLLLILLIPVTYGVFYIMSFVQVLGLCGGLIRLPRLRFSLRS